MSSWKRGRLRPGQAVGRLRIQVVDRATGLTGTTDVDVLAVKLDHETEYRQMLTDISSFAAEAVLQGFAPSMLDLAPSELPAELLYLRFAMIAAYLQDPAFEAAIARVTSQPHRTWVSEQEIRPIGSPFPAGAAFRRAVCAPGRRVPWAGGSAKLASLPAALTRDRAEASVDNSANQFVKFALERWRAVALELFDVLSAPRRRSSPDHSVAVSRSLLTLVPNSTNTWRTRSSERSAHYEECQRRTRCYSSARATAKSSGRSR